MVYFQKEWSDMLDVSIGDPWSAPIPCSNMKVRETGFLKKSLGA